MGIIARIDAWADATPDAIAHECGHRRLSYRELRGRSDTLAGRLAGLPRGVPVVVYGHKDPDMLVSFLGVVKSGRPYIPVDRSWPADRIAAVVAESGAALVIATEPLPDGIDLAGVATASGPDAVDLVRPGIPVPVAPDEPFYVIYTSGSTGRPKGVQISRSALERFVDWSATFTDPPARDTARAGAVWLNQAPFSFDLSVMDLYGALSSGGTLHSITSDLVARPRDLYADLRTSDVSVWVSTPSFADLCLAEPSFDQTLLPRAAVFWFCGETLAPQTARTLLDRFPGAIVHNTYGPTESTVAVTGVRVDASVLAHGGALPVGYAKPGTTILIDAEARSTAAPSPDPSTSSDIGEVVIAGDTVSLGYRGRPDLTEAAFLTVDIDGRPTPAYRTGDLGRLDPDGLLHFLGRLDNQIKLHGYRIEIEDIENNLRRLDDVVHAAVIPVRREDGTVLHLQAYLQLGAPTDLAPLAFAADVKRRLKQYLPDYMVPKLIRTVTAIPLTSNGKVDRRRLAEAT
jgi:D-alanine--poly(phosphoribitol) ligase subunit 1